MWSHLRTYHPNEYSLGESKKSKSISSVVASKRSFSTPIDQPRITSAFERRTPYSRDGVKWRTVTDKLTKMIAKLMLPFSIVDEPEFQDFVAELDVRYQVPDRKYISNVAIPAKYNEMKAKVIGDLKEAKHVSLTSDAWSSGTMDPYLSLTVHYITPSWTLQSYCLRTIYMPQSHTGENIAAMIRNVLREYNVLLGNVTSITTDSGSNMVKACDELYMVRVPCFGHILHNGINTATKQEKIVEMIKSVRSIVTTFSHSGKLKLNLKKLQKEKGLQQKGLVGECSTRWGSKFRMVERLLYNKEPVQSILMSDRKFARHSPTWENLQYMETFLATLKPFSALTDALSNSKTVTIPQVWPMIKLMKATCSRAIEADVSGECKAISQDIRMQLWNYVDTRYKDADRGKLTKLMRLATYLDPRLAEPDDDVTESLVVHAVTLELDSEEGAEPFEGSQTTHPDTSSSREPQAEFEGDLSLMDLLMNVSGGLLPASGQGHDRKQR